MRYAKKNNQKAKRGALIALCVTMSLLLVALVVLTVFLHKWDNWKNQINYVSTTSVTQSQLYKDMLESGDLIENDEQIINILLIGQDAREGQGRQRSDSMILCTINLKNNTLTLTSFMRDMYVEIPGYSANRINTAYQLGGMELLDMCLLQNFGVVVDYNIEIDFEGFMEIIDTVGGVEIELTQEEANYLNRKGNWDVDNSTAGQWDLTAGPNMLTGEQALAYCRTRYVGNADFGRTERQRKVLTALMDRCRTMSITELDALMNKILPMITTDMDQAQIDQYVLNVLPVFTKLEVKQLRVPADGAYYNDTIREMSVLVPDLEKNKALLQEVMS